MPTYRIPYTVPSGGAGQLTVTADDPVDALNAAIDIHRRRGRLTRGEGQGHLTYRLTPAQRASISYGGPQLIKASA